jgi:Domain of unknown function (DUF4332)
MNIDWAYVKKQTLWSYEDLIEKLLNAFTYGFVLEHYNHSMQTAKLYAVKVQQGYLQGKDEASLTGAMVANFEELAGFQVGTYLDLVECVKTRADCEAFLRSSNFKFESLIQTLNYLFRWVLPFSSPLRELIDVEDGLQKAYYELLKGQRLVTNLDLLEIGRKKAGRARLSRDARVPEVFILALAHKSDISRLAYVRGKTVNHLCGGGYNTLEKIAHADPVKMEKDMDAYYRTLGKSSADFKSVILLPWIIGGAQILPRVMEE